MKKNLVSLLLIILSSAAFAQQNAGDTVVHAFVPFASFAYQFPGGEIAHRYGQDAAIGTGLFYKTDKNWLWSGDINFIFGNTIHNGDSILNMVLNSDGYIIDGNGTYALYALYERGYSLNIRVGKILPVLKANPNSGLMLMGGFGYLVHRLKIDNQHLTAPQISRDYAKGYDRLTGGINLNEFVGYYFMGKSHLWNFYGGFEFYQAFTHSLRDYVFDMMKKDNNRYLDLFFGFKIGWMVPVYRRLPEKYYYH